MEMVRYFFIVSVILLVGIFALGGSYVIPKNARIGVVILEDRLPVERYVPVSVSVDVTVEMRQNVVEIRRRIPDPQVQTAIIKRLRDFGYNVEVFEISDADLQMALGNPVKAVEIAARQGIDILIIGEAFASYAGKAEGLIYYRSMADLKVISTKDKYILFTASAMGSGRDLAPDLAAKKSLRDLGENLADLLIPGAKKKITFACNVKDMKGMPHDITEADFGYYWLREIKEMLEQKFPTIFREMYDIVWTPTWADITPSTVYQKSGDLLLKNSQYILFFEISAWKVRDEGGYKYAGEVDVNLIDNDREKLLFTLSEPLKFSYEKVDKYWDYGEYSNSCFRKFIDRGIEKLFAREIFKTIGDFLMGKLVSQSPEPVVMKVEKPRESVVVVRETTRIQPEKVEFEHPYIASVELFNGAIYRGEIEGKLVFQSLSGDTIQLDPWNVKKIEWIYGEMYRIEMIDGSVEKARIWPDMTITVKTKTLGQRIVKMSDIRKIEVEVRTH